MTAEHSVTEGSSISFVGNYLPRRCGIATFTHDLCEAVARAAGESRDVFAVAMNDAPEGYPYPPRVRFEVRQNIQADYRLAAEFLNINQVSAVCLQHEYGIFGGACGSHSLSLLRRLRRPLVSTFHTVLKEPTREQKLVLQETIRLSNRVVVMAEIARDMLKEVYQAPEEKIAVIPHGIPDVPFVDPHFYKAQFGVEGRRVLMTFGLLSPGKGLEYAIDALPDVVKKYPDAVYIILGATHPHVKAESGEEYRNSLTRRTHELGLRDNVIFVNRFVEHKELCEYLGACDIYLTPYLHEAQITSGTLAYAAGAGKAIVSTPYWHAAELLDDGRGRLVPFRNADAIAEQILDLFDHETQLHAMRRKAYNYCRSMVWPQTARAYLNLFQEATDAWIADRHREQHAAPRRKEQFDVPDVDLRHLRLLTDDTGILQHCLFTTPHRDHGYCTDDNARALIATALHWDLNHDESILPLMQTYLAFMAHALNEKTGRFRNFMSYDRRWLEAAGSEDSHGRSIWGLGMAVALAPHESTIALATRLFQTALAPTERFTAPRAWRSPCAGCRPTCAGSEAIPKSAASADYSARNSSTPSSGTCPRTGPGAKISSPTPTPSSPTCSL
jgi:glycosyltransferase involved in cell wall biosynthesis